MLSPLNNGTMIPTIEWMKKTYNKYNKKFWEGNLPEVRFEIVEKMGGDAATAGYVINRMANTIRPTYIRMTTFREYPENILRNIFLHEMIHIADYSFHPEHYIMYGRVNKHYNAHGKWFLNEAARLNKTRGINVNACVTKEELATSTRSPKEQARINRKIANSRIIILEGNNNKYWAIRTTSNCTPNMLTVVTHYNWDYELNGVKNIKVLTHKDEKVADANVRRTSLRGRYFETPAAYKEFVKNIKGKATDEFNNSINYALNIFNKK